MKIKIEIKTGGLLNNHPPPRGGSGQAGSERCWLRDPSSSTGPDPSRADPTLFGRGDPSQSQKNICVRGPKLRQTTINYKTVTQEN